jgi:hypothetical protein
MNRRRFVRSLGALVGMASLSGCVAPTATASFTYRPSNPVAGESILFDASDSEGDAYRWTFRDAEGDELHREGEMVTVRTDGPGKFTARLRVGNANPAMNPALCLAGGDGVGCSVDETVSPVYVRKSGDAADGLRVDTDRVNLLLTGSETRIAVDETATLQFSSANLIGNETLTVQLLLETPSGLAVTSGAFVESGQGQYTSTFVLDPGESKGVRIRVGPRAAGQHTVTGHAVYYFGDDTDDRTARSVRIPITVTG